MQSDVETITRVLEGDRDAFAELIRRHQDAVYRMARGLLSDASEAEDAAQETFLKAFTALRRFDAQRAMFKTWLLIITRRVCLNVLAKQRPGPLGAVANDSQACPPDEDMLRAERFEALDDALVALSIEQRACWILTRILELSYREVAEIEGVDIGTVKSRLGRARARLQEIMMSKSFACEEPRP